jgi:hypothetical protein
MLEESEEMEDIILKSFLSRFSEVEILPALKHIFFEAVVKGNDKSTNRFFSLMMQMTEDLELKSVIDENGCLKKDHYQEEENAKKRRAETTVELFGLIPGFQSDEKEISIVLTLGDGQKFEQPTKILHCPNFLETKKAMLEEIAWRWKTTEDEEEADNLFAFLVSVFTKIKYQEERGIFELIVKKSTDYSFSVKRLLRHFLFVCNKPFEFSYEKDGFAKIGKILSIALTRNNELSVMVDVWQSVEPLVSGLETIHGGGVKCDPNVFELLAQHASAIAQLKEKACVLEEQMQMKDDILSPTGKWKELKEAGHEPVFGDIEIGFVGDGSFFITVTQTKNVVYRSVATDADAKKQFGNELSKILKHAKKFHEENLQIRFIVNFVLEDQGKIMLFEKKKVFLPKAK